MFANFFPYIMRISKNPKPQNADRRLQKKKKKKETDLSGRKRKMFSTNVKIYEPTYKTMDGIDFRPIGRQNGWTGKLS